MTEQDLELQQLRRENAELRKERDLSLQAHAEMCVRAQRLEERLETKQLLNDALRAQRNNIRYFYTKMCEKAEQLEKELKFTRKFIRDNGLEFAMIDAWNRRVNDERT